MNTLGQIPNLGKTIVVVRFDLNVPLQRGSISDDTRIQRALPTIKYLRNAGATIVILSHFDRPKGRVDPAMSLRPVVERLQLLLKQPVALLADIAAAPQKISTLQAGSIVCIENLRFHPGEENNDAAFAQQLASLGDVYVNDAFSCSHRAHASIAAITQYLPAYAGLGLTAELDALARAFNPDNAPIAALVGGAKVSTKLAVLENLVQKVDYIILGGGMANTFLLYHGYAVGSSLVESTMLDTVANIYAAAKLHNCTLVIPTDVRIADSFDTPNTARVVGLESIPDTAMILDCGDTTMQHICAIIDQCQTLVWNGPLGVFEVPPFDTATVTVAKHAAAACTSGTLTAIAGGGDTISALNTAGVTDDFSYVSTAGGAFLAWLEGKTLPGIAALTT